MTIKAFVAMAVLAHAGCATSDARFAEGMKSFHQGQWQSSVKDLEGFVETNCGTLELKAQCKEARLATAEAYLRLGELRKAYLLVERSRWDEPQTDAMAERTKSLQAMAQNELSGKLRRGPGTVRVGVRFESETLNRLRFLRLTLALDFHLLRGEGGRVEGKTASLTVPPKEISAGEHHLDVIAVFVGTGSVNPGYRFTAQSDKVLTVADGDSLDVQVRVTEVPNWTSPQETLQVAIDVSNRPGVQKAGGNP